MPKLIVVNGLTPAQIAKNIETKKNETIKFRNDLKGFIVKGSSLQSEAQDLAIRAFSYALRFSHDTSMITEFLNQSLSVKFLKTEGLSYWFKHIAGINCKYDKDKNLFTEVNFKLPKDFKSDLGIIFTYDSKHMAKCKLAKNRFWLIAPLEHKELKVSSDLEKLSESYLNRIARSVLAGAVSEELALLELAKLATELTKAMNDKKNKEWVDKYLAEQVKLNPPSDSEREALEQALTA